MLSLKDSDEGKQGLSGTTCRVSLARGNQYWRKMNMKFALTRYMPNHHLLEGTPSMPSP
jgi:hypothetical protein